MGVDTIAITEHTLDTSATGGAVALLEPVAEAIRPHVAVWKKWGAVPKRWPIELRPDPPLTWHARPPTVDYPFTEVEGPYGIRLVLGARLCEISALVRWGAFIGDEPVQAAVTALCMAVASCLGAKQVIYVPDSAYCPSSAMNFLEQYMPLEAVIDWLSHECGPPAPTISSIGRELSDEEMRALSPGWTSTDRARAVERDGYFVEGEGLFEYLVNIVEPGPRPPFYQVAEHLWGAGCNIDSDGDSRTVGDTQWTELTIELRGADEQRVDVDPISADPLVLQVRSFSAHLAEEVAKFIAGRSGGKTAPMQTRARRGFWPEWAQ